eukprot:gnl/TRDRNA2_/TRDRNA2_182502_c0_seq1.p2 gnl/TRDRNA2_/TRDRNA2_182502_c0~~gnl/TRDRNA2_/TRDRNA2_182502_c0_seq1.p2  ORF type:complete len:209 (-),score=66.12 gnl/TRDRNA2_/TRDRNA2_182502_c0_seq1:116-664(-)
MPEEAKPKEDGKTAETDAEKEAAEKKAKMRADIEAKVAAAKEAAQKKADQEAAEVMKKKEIEEKGTAFYGDHSGITCDGCGCAPIFGYRYRCKECPNHDICEACYDLWCGGKGTVGNGLAKQIISTKASDHSFQLFKDQGFKSIAKGGGMTVKSAPKVKPNDPCPCGSGAKYKKCCMNKQEK